MEKRKILVTSALPYSNGDIHFGHLFEYLQTDFWVRFQKMRGHACLYFCADDTHGTPVMLEAKRRGIDPEVLVEGNRAQHIADFKAFGIEFTHYSSTNSETNRILSEDIFNILQEKDHIRLKNIEQSYCESCKIFLPDRFIKGICPNCKTPGQYGDSCEACSATYTPKDLVEPRCVVCGAGPALRKSNHLFFEINHFRAFLLEWIKKHTSCEVANKLEEWFKDGARLRAWDISRDAPYFGFKIPGYADKYFYVWVDAPIGYIAATEEWAREEGGNYLQYWKEQSFEIYHFIGKDIIYFHSLFWPAMLKAAGLSTPTKIMTHGFLTLNGKKMSKSKGYFINAKTYLENMEPLYLRYYLAAKMSPSINDVDFNLAEFATRINAELIGKITNLASRSVKLLHKQLDGKLGTPSAWGAATLSELAQLSKDIANHYENREFGKVIVFARETAEKANRYFDSRAPWKLPPGKEQQSILTDVLLVFRTIAIWLTPIMPSYSKKASQLFSEPPFTWESLEKPPKDIVLRPFVPLAQRLQQEDVDKLLKS